MMRNENWPRHLSAVIRASFGRPFSWGENDCCLFAADCCVAVCNVDPAEQYRGKYKTEAGAKRKLKELHGSLEAAWDAYFERIDVKQAGRGDVVLYDGAMGKTVGVLWAGDVWSITEDGAARVACEPKIAWRVDNG